MRELISIIENASAPASDAPSIWVRATSWEALPEYLHRKFPHVKLAATNWGMCGAMDIHGGANTRVWPIEFDPNRWPGKESDLRNHQAYDVVIDALKYVTPSAYRSRVGKPHTRLFFKISPVVRNGQVIGGYVEVLPKPQNTPMSNVSDPKPLVDMDDYYKAMDEMDRVEAKVSGR